MTVCPNFLRVATERWGRFIRITSVFKSINSISVRSKIFRRGEPFTHRINLPKLISKFHFNYSFTVSQI